MSLVYMDDLNTVSSIASGANTAKRRITSGLERASLRFNLSKELTASGDGPADVLGLPWWRSGHLTVWSGMAVRRFYEAVAIIGVMRACPHELN